jgi:hypothetical protein
LPTFCLDFPDFRKNPKTNIKTAKSNQKSGKIQTKKQFFLGMLKTAKKIILTNQID